VARPRGFQIEDAEADLLDTFWAKGYEGAGIRQLCAATGQRPASLYAAFGDKDAMFRASMQRYLRWIEGQLTPPEQGAAGVRHILETTCRLTLADRNRRGCLIVNAVAERENLSPEANAVTRDSFDRLRDLLRQQVHSGFEGGMPDGAEDMVNLLVGATVSIRLLGRAGASRAELAGIVSGALDAFSRWSGQPR
jgi:TetR/AcrR family transcriptional repressor of nem operon